MKPFDPKATPTQRLLAIDGLVKDLSTDERPIILGPWRSEVGFEGLYWLPFLKKLADRVPKFKQRSISFTRGGMGALYADVASGGIDLYALRSVTDIRRQNLKDYHASKLQKQMAPTPWDSALATEAARAAGLGGLYHVVHPSWMYWACAPYWDEQAGLQHLAPLTDYSPIPKPKLTADSPLPPRYVAVKFYNRATFPYVDERHRAQLAEFIKSTVATVAAQTPVVLLRSAADYDDHVDVPISGPNITALEIDGPPDQNLWQQAIVLAHATAFVGVYGGVAQLALRLGVPSMSVYHQWGATAHAHLSLSSALSKKTGVEFLVGSIDDVHMWKQCLVPMTDAVEPVKAEVTA